MRPPIQPNAPPSLQQRVVVVGGGFAGLTLIQHLRHAPVNIVLIDRCNHHVFQPLLYQVATAALSPDEIAEPTRSILRNARNVTVRLDEAVGVDTARRQLLLREGGSLAYDYLVLATGVEYDYFGHDGWSTFAPSLKTLQEAAEIRGRLLLAFEHAENCLDPDLRQRLLTIVLVGGGPTGVELAGSIAELARFALRRDFRNIDPTTARIILLEAGPHLLTGFHPKLRVYAKAALERLRVEVRLHTPVEMIDADGVTARGERIDASVVLWCAGVKATPMAACLGAPTTRQGAIRVAPDLSVPGTSNIFAIGDVAALDDEAGKPLPLLAPVAKQEGAYVARLIRSQLEGKARPAAFCYRDPGSLAIIGRSAAAVDFGFIQITGLVGWLVWTFAHIFFLIGFRNKIAVFLEWAWQWVTYARGARLIIGSERVGRDREARSIPSSPVVFPRSPAPTKSE
ncbi:MAG TPA: NAD(P)/FAD-dependent oxidoreductase [Gemmatimonadales bacterium]|nr:NAD(P)/FAD-dependent oxidoreductase [Gemmatimonadales bacterium]